MAGTRVVLMEISVQERVSKTGLQLSSWVNCGAFADARKTGRGGEWDRRE